MPTKAGKSVSAAAAAASAPKQQAAAHDSTIRVGGRVSVAQVEKACAALSAHRERSRKSGDGNALPLDGEDDEEGEGARSDPSDVVWMQVTVKTLNANAPAKPIRLPTPHPVYAKSSSICLLTADPQRTYKDLMVAERLTQVKRVVGVSKLKGKFAPFEARRQLMNEHDLFLADDRIVPMLPKLLGKKWMGERKTPIPVKLTKNKDGQVRKEIEAALASTFFHRNKGTCASVRLGSIRHLTPAQLAENVAAALPAIVSKHVKSGWSNVQSIDIKTGSSAALPVWNCNMSERWEGLPEKRKATEASEVGAEVQQGDEGVIKSKTAKPSPPKARSTVSRQIVKPKVKPASKAKKAQKA